MSENATREFRPECPCGQPTLDWTFFRHDQRHFKEADTIEPGGGHPVFYFHADGIRHQVEDGRIVGEHKAAPVTSERGDGGGDDPGDDVD